MRIGFIGAGQMAVALAKGIAAKSDVKFAAFDPNPNSIDTFQVAIEGRDFAVCNSNAELVRDSELVFLAVKPQVIDLAMESIPDIDTSEKLFVSVVAGVSIAKLQRLTGSKQIVRTMPNTPCLIGCGAIAMVANDAVPEEHVVEVRDLLSGAGLVVDVLESQIDAVTGLSGSGPAYVYTFVETLIDAGVCAGLPRHVARELAIQTVVGTMRMVQEGNEHPANLRDRVTSPGGTTIFGMSALEKGGFRSSIYSAVQSATSRAGELGAEE